MRAMGMQPGRWGSAGVADVNEAVGDGVVLVEDLLVVGIVR